MYMIWLNKINNFITYVSHFVSFYADAHIFWKYAQAIQYLLIVKKLKIALVAS